METCLQHIDPSKNALAIVTGKASDYIVIDIDTGVGKDGCTGTETWKRWVDGQALPSCPISRTQSGGKHMFFSRTASVAAGLTAVHSTANVLDPLTRQKTSIDVRCDGGMSIVHPTKVQHGGEYTWDTPLPPSDQLPACPSWLVMLLNTSANTRAPSGTTASRSQGGAEHRLVAAGAADLQVPSVQPQVTNKIEEMLKADIDKVYSVGRDGFSFILSGKGCLACELCGQTHKSNNYCATSLIANCYRIRSYSTRCKPIIMGWQDLPVIKHLMRFPTKDDPFVRLFEAHQQARGRWWVSDGRSFFVQDSRDCVWKPVNDAQYRQEVRAVTLPLLAALTGYLAGQRHQADMSDDKAGAKGVADHYTALVKAHGYVQRTG